MISHGGRPRGVAGGRSSPLDIDAFTQLLEQMMERVPDRLLDGLNGGVSVAEETLRRDGDPQGVYILAEYITDPYLGAMIVLYHGSFVKLFRTSPHDVWERELWDTLRHELRHHVEGRAGISDLDSEDAMELERMRQTAKPGARYRVRGMPPRPQRRH